MNTRVGLDDRAELSGLQSERRFLLFQGGGEKGWGGEVQRGSRLERQRTRGLRMGRRMCGRRVVDEGDQE